MPCDKTKDLPFMEQPSGYSQRYKHNFRSWLKACCQRRCGQAGNWQPGDGERPTVGEIILVSHLVSAFYFSLRFLNFYLCDPEQATMQCLGCVSYLNGAAPGWQSGCPDSNPGSA